MLFLLNLCLQVIKDKPFHLVEDAAQIKKMLQLKESMDQRMGCVVVGPSGSGKSTLWRVLKAAMIKYVSLLMCSYIIFSCYFFVHVIVSWVQNFSKY